MKPLWLIIFCLLLTACNDSESNMTNITTPVEIVFNSPIKNLLDTSDNEFSPQCMKDLELCWYKIEKSANDKNLPNAVVKNGSSSLNLKQITNITIFVDEMVGNQIENLNITLRGLPDNSTHEQQKTFTYQIIEDIKTSGWKHYYFVEDPRISGSQTNKIKSPDNVVGHSVSSHPWLDPHYPLDIDHWLKISPFYYWNFYNNGAYLSLKAWRRDSNDNPTKTGTYLISLEFKSEREFWKDGITDKTDRLNWKELLPARIESFHATRLKIEEKARAAGIEIDESYQDPPIHALE
jgi:hypothetical protein